MREVLFNLLAFVSKWNKKDFKSESGLSMPFYAFQMRLLAIFPYLYYKMAIR